MNTVLDDAEQRIAPAADRQRTLHKEIVDGMREEIGKAHYASAKGWLTKQEQAIAQTYQPFLDRIAGVQSQTTVPLPRAAQASINEMMTLCEAGPRQLRDGLNGWEKLSPPFLPDGRTIDPNLRGTWVMGIRQCLMSGEDILNRLEILKIYIENAIRDHRWPDAPGRDV